MEVQFSKYHGAGNDFIMLDDTSGKFRSIREHSYDIWCQLLAEMCDRRSGIGADGVITVYPGSSKKHAVERTENSRKNEKKDDATDTKNKPEGIGLDLMSCSVTSTKISDIKDADNFDDLFDDNGSSGDPDFTMTYFDPDGSQGTLCGNGSRCALLFAADVGIVSYNKESSFTVCMPNCNLKLKGKIIETNNGTICANGEAKPSVRTNYTSVIRITMPDVETGVKCLNRLEYFVDTGSPHYVKILPNNATLQNLNVEEEGKKIRFSEEYVKIGGTNVNYIAINSETRIINIRTYERGVESETRACGTGAVAAAIVSFHEDLLGNPSEMSNLKQHFSRGNSEETLAVREGNCTTAAMPSRELFRDVLARGGKLTVRIGQIDSINADGLFSFRKIELGGPATKVFTGIYYFAEE